MLNALRCHRVWQDFLEYKKTGGHLSREEEQALSDWIQSKAYLPVVERIIRGETFAPPQKSEISKMGSDKKRIVYTYAESENRVLKLLTFLLQGKYDPLFADNLYSFRPGKGVRDAVIKLISAPNIQQMWSYKVDIRNYFNSIPVDRLLPVLKQALERDPNVYRFLESLLTNPLVNDRGNLIPEEKGIMAGTPVSTFLANLYLSHMDHRFAENGVLYARYSDDIILFAPTQKALEERILQIRGFLSDAGLTVNPRKEVRTAPGEMWEFLGICYRNGTVDVAPASVEKLKAKMRRKTRALVRWQIRKNATGVQAAKAFVRVWNRKLFENPAEHELTWARWYFPLINTPESLKVIDAYAQNCIRFLATGKRTKAAYNFRYAQIKALGYVSLVNCYYKRDLQQ